MALTYQGVTTFTDIGNPVTSKNDWGIDTIIRRVRGPVTNLDTYVAGLAQGQGYNGFYLQTWGIDDRPPYATVTLYYKGLHRGTIPDPAAFDETGICSTSIGADVASLNITNSDGVAAKTAVRDIEFYCPQTTWRYIRYGRPSGYSYGAIANGRTATIIRNVIRLDNGMEYRGNAPAGLVTALYLNPSNRIIGPHAEPVHGTPYYECHDIVANGYWA